MFILQEIPILYLDNIKNELVKEILSSQSSQENKVYYEVEKDKTEEKQQVTESPVERLDKHI